jgi:hypothetical protein
MTDQLDSVSSVPSLPTTEGASPRDRDQLDLAGQTIIGLLHKAAGAAETTSRQALETAQKLSPKIGSVN